MTDDAKANMIHARMHAECMAVRLSRVIVLAHCLLIRAPRWYPPAFQN